MGLDWGTTDGFVGQQNDETEKGEHMSFKIHHSCIIFYQEQEEKERILFD